MSPYELENLPHTLKRVRTQSIVVIRGGAAMPPGSWLAGKFSRPRIQRSSRAALRLRSAPLLFENPFADWRRVDRLRAA